MNDAIAPLAGMRGTVPMVDGELASAAAHRMESHWVIALPVVDDEGWTMGSCIYMTS